MVGRFVLLVLLVFAPAWAATVHDLVAEADKIVHADDSSMAALQHAVALYQDAARIEPGNARIHVGLAEAALAVGEDLDRDALRWYEIGQAAAERAIALDGNIAHAYFLHAANRGHVAKLGPLLKVSPRIVGYLEDDLRKALALEPRHAHALHMMGVLLRDTPLFLRGFLKGKASESSRYLFAAVEADPNFAQARLDLAEYYKSAGRVTDARLQAKAVVDLSRVSHARPLREKFGPAAEALLKTLPVE